MGCFSAELRTSINQLENKLKRRSPSLRPLRLLFLDNKKKIRQLRSPAFFVRQQEVARAPHPFLFFLLSSQQEQDPAASQSVLPLLRVTRRSPSLSCRLKITDSIFCNEVKAKIVAALQTTFSEILSCLFDYNRYTRPVIRCMKNMKNRSLSFPMF